MEIFLSFTSHYPKTPVPVVNNPIRSKYLHQTLVNFSASPAGDWQTGCLWWEVVESRFHVDLKSNCALINTSMEFLLGPIIRRINLLYESRMKWTWHYSKLAVEEVSFFGGLRVVLLQLLSIGDGAVGVTNLGIMLLWLSLSVELLSHCTRPGTAFSLCNSRDHCTHSLIQDCCIVKLITSKRATYLHLCGGE